MRYLTHLVAALCLLTGAAPAFADGLIYAPGTRIGLVPLIGLSPAKAFPGFETVDHQVKVVVAELPPAAFRDVEAAARSDAPGTQGPKPQGIETASGQGYFIVENAKSGNDNVRRYSMVVSGNTFSGYVAAQVPENVEKIYSDQAVQKMFATVALRKEVPIEEQLGLLPFKLTELSSFKTVRTLGPGAILLSDAETDTDIDSKAFMIITPIGSTPERPDDRGRFARDVATTIPNLREARITMSEPMRINGSPGFETRIDATNAQTNAPVTVVQWLAFGSGNTAMRLIGSTPRDGWSAAFPRFRAVRDGIRPKSQ
ncbi:MULTISPECIES: hypothetical protein [unclassified Nitrobacter]|jgi:hypothetical protein|uniref:hypothetical protein n=1 Tax=unclassified Nitrobacter TaxID=2620411 RepID=UPI00092BFA8B|nr:MULTISPECIES: hypothetical protein [unclassified Nitrobacter]MBN9148458.1 hypothetical protein [Nitrobacter sp.]OJV00139.1 MAG: hypothetical protein BGO16_06225 [Nitrobacter sp. 62-23]